MENTNPQKDNNLIYNDKYYKVGKCGRGAYGKILKCIDANERVYAIKVFFLDNAKNDKTNIVKRQFEILKKTHHKNIIKAYDYFTHKENECISFEYIENDILKFLLNKNFKIDETFIKATMKQILEGVQYLHEQGLMHRDLKPDNILLGQDGVIKIADFDLLREYANEPLTKGVVTIYYKPPEVFYGDVNYDFSIDMWSVGCILAELILREPIFKGRSELDVIYKIYEVLSSANVIFFNF
jgi:serine/threonine protein kinase